MAYTPTTWVTGDTVTATKLNKMEQGIASAGGGDVFFDISEEDGVLDKTWTEILTALTAGKIARIVGYDEDFASCLYVTDVNTDEEFYYIYVAGSQAWYQASSASGYPEFTD